jgi:hypothetical protein
MDGGEGEGRVLFSPFTGKAGAVLYLSPCPSITQPSRAARCHAITTPRPCCTGALSLQRPRTSGEVGPWATMGGVGRGGVLPTRAGLHAHPHTRPRARDPPRGLNSISSNVYPREGLSSPAWSARTR